MSCELHTIINIQLLITCRYTKRQKSRKFCSHQSTKAVFPVDADVDSYVYIGVFMFCELYTIINI